MFRRLVGTASVALLLALALWWGLAEIIARAENSYPGPLITIICTAVLGKLEPGACEHPTRLLPRVEESCLQNLEVQAYLSSIRNFVSAHLDGSVSGIFIFEFPNYRLDPLICADVPRYRGTAAEKALAKATFEVPPIPQMKAAHKCLLGGSVEIPVGSEMSPNKSLEPTPNSAVQSIHGIIWRRALRGQR